MSRKTRAVIHLDHILANYLLANKWAPSSKNIAVIKADAYGHGIVEVAKYLESTVSAFAVAIFDEAMILRKNGIKKDILILQGVNSVDEVTDITENNIWTTIHNLEQLGVIKSARLKNKLSQKISVWLKVDTGMHRLGLSVTEFRAAFNQIKRCDLINDDLVIASHFSCADELDNDETLKQIDVFKRLSAKLNLDSLTQFSLANSAALAYYSDARLDWNRPGIMLYGVPLFDRPHKTDQELRAAMSFESCVIGIRKIKAGESVGYGKKWIADKPSIIATISVGYADGYPRHAKNGTPVIVHGRKVKLVGRVSMDLICVDISDIDEVQVGDSVELWGENLSVNEVASWAGTIAYDLITGVSKRVPRIYKSNIKEAIKIQ
ncbi:MAG: alanine racemase [Kangiellaceae bacterium]|nr:alanine racemase [Kangiellaceae bacterium]